MFSAVIWEKIQVLFVNCCCWNFWPVFTYLEKNKTIKGVKREKTIKTWLRKWITRIFLSCLLGFRSNALENHLCLSSLYHFDAPRLFRLLLHSWWLDLHHDIQADCGRLQRITTTLSPGHKYLFIIIAIIKYNQSDMRRQAANEPQRHAATQSLWFLAGFSDCCTETVSLFLQQQGLWRWSSIWTDNKGLKGNKNTLRLLKLCVRLETRADLDRGARMDFLTWLIPNQSARSRALARAVDRPTTLTPFEVWEEMKLVLDTITSNTGPRSSPGNKH